MFRIIKYKGSAILVWRKSPSYPRIVDLHYREVLSLTNFTRVFYLNYINQQVSQGQKHLSYAETYILTKLFEKYFDKYKYGRESYIMLDGSSAVFEMIDRDGYACVCGTQSDAGAILN